LIVAEGLRIHFKVSGGVCYSHQLKPRPLINFVLTLQPQIINPLAEKSNYITENKAEIITEIDDIDDVIGSFNLSIHDLINLAGGIPSDKIRELHVKVICHSEDVIDIYITTSLYEVVRVLNFGMHFISNTHMYVYDQQHTIGTKLFCNQVVAAREKGFKVIYTTAMGKEDGDNWTGYYTWGRLGYQMILGDDERFIRLMEGSNRHEQGIWELLSSEEGRVFWLENGFTWMGQFLLHDGSSTLEQLRNYLKEKGELFGID